jgi:hypothetical protein
LTNFPGGVDVAALRRSLHRPFTLPDPIPDRLTEFPARVDVEAPLERHHTFTLPNTVPDHLIVFPAHVDVEALRKQRLLEDFCQKHKQPTN